MSILDRTEFLAQFGDIYHSIFQGIEADRKSFVRPDWSFVLLPFEFNLTEHAFQAIAYAAREHNDDDFVATVVETLPPHEASCVIPWEYSAMQIASRETFLCALVGTMFGRSAQWGAICSKDDYTIIGGDEKFMNAFLERSGGMDQLRMQFLQDIEAWQVSENFRNELLSQVGWL